MQISLIILINKDMSLTFTTKLNGFCEATIYGGPPEYINAITSLFITFIGYYAIQANSHSNQNILMLYASLIINGMASCIYHWTHYNGWGHFDAVSMILISMFSMLAMKQEIEHLYNIKNRKVYIDTSFMLYFTVMIVSLCLDNDLVFRILFGCFLVFILIGVVLINNVINNNRLYLDNEIVYNGHFGMFCVAFSGISWIITETLCDSVTVIKYIPGHAFWHIFISYGGYHVSQLILALSFVRQSLKFTYNSTGNINKYLPTVDSQDMSSR